MMSLAGVVLACIWVGAHSSPCSNRYKEWLSERDVFPRNDQPNHLAGLHVACVWVTEQGQPLEFEVYKNGVHADSAVRASIEGDDALASWRSFRKHLKDTIGIKRKSAPWGHMKYKQPFGVFNQAGHRLGSPQAALDAQLILIFESGQWMWPPVRKGFVRPVDGTKLKIETLSVQPMLFRVNGFLRDSECDKIIGQSEPRLQKSTVSLQQKDKGRVHKDFRTSSQVRLDHTSPTLNKIYNRVANLTRIPVIHNEQIQILRYEKSEYYSAHQDSRNPTLYNDHDNRPWEWGHRNRLLTVFWYLSNVSKGGETIFPRADGLPQPHDMWSCEKGLKVKPERLAVILYYNLEPNGNDDKNSMHGACPVVEGVKWAGNYWVWNKPQDHSRMPDDGVDEEEDDSSDSETEIQNAGHHGVKVWFKNELSRNAHIFWVRPDTKESKDRYVPISVADAGGTASLNTHPTHHFVAKASADWQSEVLGKYEMGQDKEQHYTISALKQGAKTEL